MYSLESGEPSVWDKELGKAYLEGEGGCEDSIEKTRPRRRPSTTKKAAPTTTSEHKVLRSEHNLKVMADQKNSFLRRKLFIKANWEHIKNFVHSGAPSDEEVAGVKNIPSYPSLTKQPACLHNVTMRDYQLAGVNWLIKAYESGISVILGDEM